MKKAQKMEIVVASVAKRKHGADSKTQQYCVDILCQGCR